MTTREKSLAPHPEANLLRAVVDRGFDPIPNTNKSHKSIALSLQGRAG